jgi:hypothetical protein
MHDFATGAEHPAKFFSAKGSLVEVDGGGSVLQSEVGVAVWYPSGTGLTFFGMTVSLGFRFHRYDGWDRGNRQRREDFFE